jgi:hypothetical protein
MAMAAEAAAANVDIVISVLRSFIASGESFDFCGLRSRISRLRPELRPGSAGSGQAP